jgi:hypothetical protein
MANHSKFIKLLLSFVIAISPIVLINNANAASLGGWSLGGGVAQGASTVYEGTKQVIIDGKDYIKKGTAIVTPTATGVAKVLAKGVAGVALSVAVEQLIGAVDWVLDPANNQIKYSSPDQPLPTYKYIWIWNGTSSSNKSSAYLISSTAEGACRLLAPVYSSTLSNVSNIVITSESKGYAKCNWTSGAYQYVNIDVNPTYDPAAQKEQKTIPLSTVAAQVISNAEGNTDKKAGAQVATTAAAADVVAEAENDNTKARPIAQQLEASSTTKPADEAAADKANEATGEQTKNPDKPDTTDLKLTFPIFCNWAPTVCEAAQTVISFPKTLTNWWETGKEKAESWATSISESWAAAKEWATSEPSQDNTQVDVENNNTQEIDTQVSFSTQCPAPINLANFSYHGISQSWTVDFSKFCDVFATYLKPVVISIGAFSAVLIVSGVGVRENG